MTPIASFHTKTLVVTTLPGPTRKRKPSPYCYRLTYRNPEPAVPGCRLLWAVRRGRATYPVALARETPGDLQWHCTCADAVYRGEAERHHQCKHIRGLLNVGRTPPEPVAAATSAACCAEAAA